MTGVDFFEIESERDRQKRLREAREAHEAFQRADDEATAKRAEATRQHMLGASERQRLAEYRFHGVEPPIIDGAPTRTSFHLLIQIGWRVEENLGQKFLVAPQAIEQALRRGREFYDSNS